MRTLKLLWQRISNLGVTATLDPSDRRRVVFVNRVLFLFFLVTLPMALPWLNPEGYVFEASTLLLYLGILYLNTRKQYELAQVLILLLGDILIFTQGWLNGLNNGEILNFFLVVVGAPAILDFSKWIHRIWAIGLPMILATLLVNRWVLGEVPFEPTNSFWINLGVTLFNTFIIAAYYFRMTERQTDETRAVNSELREREVALADALNYAEQVNQELRLREQELKRAKEEAEGLAHAQEEFLSVMSHELRTPLNAVIGMSHLLRQEVPGGEAQNNLRVLQISANQLLTLINDILDFNKMRAGKMALDELPFSLRELVEGILDTHRPAARRKLLGLSLEWDDRLPEWYLGDPARLGQVVNNLVGNGLKFTEKGYVKVRVECVGDHAGTDQQRFRLVVEDTGIGIAPSQQASVFQVFSQEGAFISSRFGGTGLGLPISQRLVTLMQGWLTVCSEEKQGTAFGFTLSLPVVPAHEVPEAMPVQEEHPLEGMHVLVVEDNKVNVMVVTKFLKRWGVTFDVVEHGQKAVEQVQVAEYHLLLMDLQMPVMSGYEATKAIRGLAGKYYQEVPIIALTASALGNAQERVFDAGMNGFITKPFQPEELYRALAKYAPVPGR